MGKEQIFLVENASGPLHPSASFGLYGNLVLSDSGENFTIHVNAKGAQFSPEAGLNKVIWIVTASLLNDQQIILKQPVIQYYRYWINRDSCRRRGNLSITSTNAGK